MFSKLRKIFGIITDILVFGRQQQWWDREEGTKRYQKKRRAVAKFKKKHGYKPGK